MKRPEDNDVSLNLLRDRSSHFVLSKRGDKLTS